MGGQTAKRHYFFLLHDQLIVEAHRRRRLSLSPNLRLLINLLDINQREPSSRCIYMSSSPAVRYLQP